MTLGIDEAGRGCLVGSLFVAGVVCDDQTALEFLKMGLKDSKKLSPKKRFFLEDKIKTHGEVGFFVVKKSASEIDSLGLGVCLKLAIEEIVENGCPLANEIKIDGNTAFGLNKRYPHIQTIIKGDETTAQIAMASVLAKAFKDREMRQLHALFKEYGWDKNCGYGTKQHIEAMSKLGATPFHRHSFTLKNRSLFQTKPLDME
ncbi:ribonuclease HII [Helicobacter pylori]|uniref:ribonuclease HII n=1 Tax=Helicobacter pylori TaxID=210 RepID=UPI0018D06B3E|nr:ribonuclease HII [Helicobacter pylori]MBH0282807.1 ribonuclease HII [Helicobacter pylori]MBH0287643.1 ribonuclease HII [Helicobacter pylori]MBH0290241.1 ribonuclease HII [Helicobacter pylori]